MAGPGHGWGGSSLDGSNTSWKGELIGPAGSLIIMSHAWRLCSSVHLVLLVTTQVYTDCPINYLIYRQLLSATFIFHGF